jgi:hypothetical protein
MRLVFSGETITTVRAPFAFSGRFSYPSGPGFPLGPLALEAGGVASFDLQWGNFGSWHLRGTQYDFSSAAVSPEPASLVLLASGAGLLLRRRRSVQSCVGMLFP